MEKSSQIAWKIVPLRHFFPLKVVPLNEVLLYTKVAALSSDMNSTFACLLSILSTSACGVVWGGVAWGVFWGTRGGWPRCWASDDKISPHYSSPRKGSRGCIPPKIGLTSDVSDERHLQGQSWKVWYTRRIVSCT
jgi:hypothetical protein